MYSMFGRSGNSILSARFSRQRARRTDGPTPRRARQPAASFQARRRQNSQVWGCRCLRATTTRSPVILDEILVDHLHGPYATRFEEVLPGGVVLVDAQLEVVYRCKAETQAPSPYILVGVLAPLLGLEGLPQRDGLAGGVPAMHPEEPPQVGENGGRHPAGGDAGSGSPACQAYEIAEVGPHDLGPQHAVLGRALFQCPLHQSLELGRPPGRVPTRRMLGVPATVLAKYAPELGVVQKCPHLGVVGALEVVARLPGLPRLQQDLEVLRRMARDPRVVERRT